MDQQLPRPAPAPTRTRRDTDLEHLRLLAIFHFVGAGLALLGLLFTLGHYAVFSAVVDNPTMWQQQGAPKPPTEVFEMLKWFYVVFGAWTGVSTALNVLAGLFLRSRRHRGFLIAVAAINCLHVPLGTVLGIFTLVVLLTDSVRQLFAETTAPAV